MYKFGNSDRLVRVAETLPGFLSHGLFCVRGFEYVGGIF
jgi:hypothetical protein